MKKILISACLLGEPVRYDGQSKPCDHPLINQWLDQGRLIPFCPEVEGGLPVPRPAAEIQGGGGIDVLTGRARIKTREGDVTRPFIEGARAALATALKEGAVVALLKEKSPSCGSAFIYDGSFTGKLVAGSGVASALLRKNGIDVFPENEIKRIENCIK
ncbi:MAG: DUF523 domain-containing protein [Desulfobacterales bacterium]|nr:DUF523 domain-containing protein [Desulfobacterales bacterium]